MRIVYAVIVTTVASVFFSNSYIFMIIIKIYFYLRN